MTKHFSGELMSKLNQSNELHEAESVIIEGNSLSASQEMSSFNRVQYPQIHAPFL
jgi:hypothetical protein